MSTDLPWVESEDRLVPKALGHVRDLLDKMPKGFETKSEQGYPNSMTVTLAFDDRLGPYAQLEAFEQLSHAAMCAETLYRNLQQAIVERDEALLGKQRAEDVTRELRRALSARDREIERFK